MSIPNIIMQIYKWNKNIFFNHLFILHRFNQTTTNKFQISKTSKFTIRTPKFKNNP